MKLTLKAPVATALMIAAMAIAAPASAADTKCVVKKGGFTWNECGDKDLRSQPAGVPGAAPGGAAPANGEPNDPKGDAISLFGFSVETGPAPFDPKNNGSNPYGGGGDGGR